MKFQETLMYNAQLVMLLDFYSKERLWISRQKTQEKRSCGGEYLLDNNRR